MSEGVRYRDPAREAAYRRKWRETHPEWHRWNNYLHHVRWQVDLEYRERHRAAALASYHRRKGIKRGQG